MKQTKAKFTPGPWKFNTTKTALLSFDEKNRHFYVYNASPYNSIEPNSTDAALIAAAPELYAALEALLKAVDSGIESDPELWRRGVSLANKALAKARGES